MHQACHRLVNQQVIDVAEKARGMGLDARNAPAAFTEEHFSSRNFVSHNGVKDI
jgi:hypothetical protein